MEKKDVDITKAPVNRPPSTSSNEDLPPYAPPSYDQASSSKSISTSPVPDLIPGLTKVLTVFARGTCSCRLPTPSDELEIPIYNGTDTSLEPEYISTRPNRRSGNAVLRHRQRGDLYSSHYKWGPFRDPIFRKANNISLASDVKRPDDETDEGEAAISVKTHSFSNKIDLTVAETGRTFTWRYGKTKLSVGKKRVMVLEATGTGSTTEKGPGRPLAVLIRTNDTRTPQTSKWDAGNGGQLVIDADAESHVDEAIIVAGCLMMLKYEIDRQRGAQMAAIGAAASS